MTHPVPFAVRRAYLSLPDSELDRLHKQACAAWNVLYLALGISSVIPPIAALVARPVLPYGVYPGGLLWLMLVLAAVTLTTFGLRRLIDCSPKVRATLCFRYFVSNQSQFSAGSV
jgi:hypothetical protein